MCAANTVCLVTDDSPADGEPASGFGFLRDPERPPRRWRPVVGVLVVVAVAAAVTVVVLTRGGSGGPRRAVTPVPPPTEDCKSEAAGRLRALGATPPAWATHHVAAYN